MREIRPRHRSARADFVETLEKRVFLSRLTGIDVSHYQGTMNWTTAASRGISFAFIRALRGDTVPDTQLANNMHPTNGARAKGIVAGVYHRVLPFSNTGDTGPFVDPIIEANKFLSAGGAYMGNGFMRPVVDVENGVKLNTAPVNGYNLSTYVLAFVNRIKEVKNVTPLIYTGHYRAYLDSTVVAAMPDLWVANWSQSTYGNPITGTGGPPTTPWAPSPNWKFWQYDSPNGLGSYYGAGSTDIDLNVFNGDDINVLKQNFVVGAARIPAGPSPSNNATNVNPVALKLDWADSQGAAGYDVYVDNVLRASNLTQSEWTVSPQISGGSHQWRVVAKGVLTDAFTHVSGPTWSFTASNVPLPGVPSNPSPHNTFVSTKPVVLDWDDVANASSYDVYLGTNTSPTYSNLTVSQTPAINPADGERLWRVVAKNATGNTNGPQWSYIMDATAPTASYGAQTPSDGGSSFDFTVTYSDAGSGVDFTSLDSSDIYVSGPNGYVQSATLVSLDANANGATRIATYRVDAPGGMWDAADNGSYSVNLNASQVKDIAGGFAAAGVIGTFNVDFAAALPFAYLVGSALHVDFDGTMTPIVLSHSGGTFFASRDGTTLEFTGVGEVVGNGTESDDLLHISSEVPATLTFNNGYGSDGVTVLSGSFTFTSNLSTAQRNVDLTVAAGATAIFAASQHLNTLTVHGAAALAPGGDRVLVVNELVMTGAASRLDLSDNDLVIDYSGVSPIGSSNGGAYDGVSGLIQSGSNGGAWNGARGIFTSEPLAAAGRTTLGVTEASRILTFGADGTALFGSETVDATSILVKYTYRGDVNLDGLISGDDYTAIDFAVATPGAFAYHNGDFNYDGLISADDYTAIDFNISAQGSPL